VAVLDTTVSIDGYVDIDNPMFAPELSKYMKEEWVNIAASTNGGIPRLCNIALEAEVSNSNQLSEAKFAGGNRRALDSVCRKDPGLFIEQWWRDDVRDCELWMDNAQKIKLLVDDTNERRDKKDSRKQQRKETDVERDHEDQLEDVPFGKSLSYQTMLKDRLKKCFGSEEEFFGLSLTRQWQRLNSLFVAQGTNVEMMKTVSFNRWMTGKTNNPRITSEQRSVFDAILTASEGRTAAAIE
jgi:hypothetical protein